MRKRIIAESLWKFVSKWERQVLLTIVECPFQASVLRLQLFQCLQVSLQNERIQIVFKVRNLLIHRGPCGLRVRGGTNSLHKFKIICHNLPIASLTYKYSVSQSLAKDLSSPPPYPSPRLWMRGRNPPPPKKKNGYVLDAFNSWSPQASQDSTRWAPFLTA